MLQKPEKFQGWLLFFLSRPRKKNSSGVFFVVKFDLMLFFLKHLEIETVTIRVSRNGTLI